MRKKISLALVLCFFTILHAVLNAQPVAISFSDAGKEGIIPTQLDSIYQSAIHTKKSKAVFKSHKQQQQLIDAYTGMLNALGQFLKENDFRWESPARCFNRVYFSAEGKVDYFLFDFGRTALPKEKETEFTRLLNIFIQDYRLPVKAACKFAQCSPVIYTP